MLDCANWSSLLIVSKKFFFSTVYHRGFYFLHLAVCFTRFLMMRFHLNYYICDRLAMYTFKNKNSLLQQRQLITAIIWKLFRFSCVQHFGHAAFDTVQDFKVNEITFHILPFWPRMDVKTRIFVPSVEIVLKI